MDKFLLALFLLAFSQISMSINTIPSKQDYDYYLAIKGGVSWSGPTWHINTWGLNTVGLGYEYASKGREVYKDDLQGIFLSADALNVNITRRSSGFDSSFSSKTHESTTFGLTFDIIKIGQIIF